MTLLAIIGSDAIALPLAPSFPPSELRYILNNSEALALLTSTKFKAKAEEVLKEGLDKALVLNVLEKRLTGSTSTSKPTLESFGPSNGGMMLYTSGTTNRPVRLFQLPNMYHIYDLLMPRRKECSYQNLL